MNIILENKKPRASRIDCIAVVCIATLLATLLSVAGAQNPESSGLSPLREFMDGIRDERVSRSPNSLAAMEPTLKSKDPEDILSLLAPYKNDPDLGVSYVAWDFECRTARFHQNPAIRERVILNLFKRVRPNEGLRDRLWNRQLFLFSEEDFTTKTKGVIHESLNTEPSKTMILLLGLAGMKNELPRLKGLLEEDREKERKYYSLSWAARCARARMGVKEDILRCVETADSEMPALTNGSVVTRLLPSLGYIRQPETIVCLKRYLDSEARMPSVKSYGQGSRYCQVAIYVLAGCLEEFPVEVREGRGYSQEEIDLCREWMVEREKTMTIIR